MRSPLHLFVATEASAMAPVTSGNPESDQRGFVCSAAQLLHVEDRFSALVSVELPDLNLVIAGCRRRELHGRCALRLARRELSKHALDDDLSRRRFDPNVERGLRLVVSPENKANRIPGLDGIRLAEGFDFAAIVNGSGHVSFANLRSPRRHAREASVPF